MSDDFNWRSVESKLQRSQELVSQLNTNCYEYRKEIARLNKKLADCEVKAEHFNIIIKAINENDVVRGTWDKFMMAFRL
jgi:septal ring factor EnvC (AmiA/AmiB activator)